MVNKFRNRKNRCTTRVGAFMDFAPYVDFLFTLLIVFMITSPMLLGGIKIDLPKGKAELIIVKKEPIVVGIGENGNLFLDQNPVKLNVLADRLNDYAMGDKEIKVFVKADKDIIYDKVITVVSVIYSAGFNDVTLVTYSNKI